jgi:hypothetical protein
MRRRPTILATMAALAAAVLAACSGGAATSSPGATTTTARATSSGGLTGATAPASGATAVAGTTAARFCAGTRAVEATGTVASKELAEISGVAASRRNAGVFWVHVDSGGPAAVFGIDATGASRARVALVDATNEDWEDVAVGPGPDAGTSYLFVADIGDNAVDRRNVQVYRLPEPALTDTEAAADVITLRYPDHAHNAEAFAVHPTTGDWYVLTKEENGPSILFRARRPGAGTSTITLEPLTSLSVAPDLVTAADISPDGSALAVRTYLSVRVYPITGGDVGGALLGPACRGPLVRDAQGEALAFAADGQSLVSLSEGANVAFNLIR